MNKKTLKINLLILSLVVIVVQFFLLKDNFNSTIEHLLHMNYFWIFVACLFMFLNLLFQTYAQYKFLKEVKEDYTFISCLKIIAIGQLMNAITPFSSGGQPSQIYLLKKEKIKVSDSTNALMQNFIIYQIGLLVLGSIAIIINFTFGVMPKDMLLRKAIIIGYLVNLGIILVLIFFSKAKKVNTNLFKKIFNFIFGFKFIKNKEEKMKKVEESLDNFYNSAAKLKSNRRLTMIGFVFNVLSLIMLYMVPYFVLLALGSNEINLMYVVVLSAYVYLIGTVVPIPGGAGGLEYGFSKFYGLFIWGPVLAAAILVWRLITYYIPMVIGFVVFLFYKGNKVKKD